MEIKQLEIFACLARVLSFSKAADELYISQPTVSAQISALERTLGSQLLVRNTKGVSLTKDGADFLVCAKKILALRDQAIQNLNGEDRSIKGTIDIISSTVPAQHLLPEIIASFRRQWPNIMFRLEQADSHRVELEMSSFKYDFGVVGTVPEESRFNYHSIYDDELVLVLPGSCEEDSDSIRSDCAGFLLENPFIMREAGSGTRKEVEDLFFEIGVDASSLRVPAYFSDAHSILLAVSKGMGVSLVSKVAAGMYAEAGLLKTVEMDNALFRRKIYLLYNREVWLSPTAQAFADFARQYYQ